MKQDHDLPCGVCRDLIPLVRDGVACADTCRLVAQHVAHCAACRVFLEADGPLPAAPEPARILPGLRRRLRLWMLGVTAVGLLLGMLLMVNGDSAPYNTIVMPLLGALLWLFGGRHRRLLPLGVGGLYFAVLLVRFWAGSLGNASDLAGALATNALDALWIAALHLAGCYLGLLAAALLQYAFTKEGSDHDPHEES